MQLPIDMLETYAVGVFESPQAAVSALEALRDAGFDTDEVGVVTRDTDEGDKALAKLRETKASVGAAVGVVAGASGGVLWALSVVAGVLPVIGPVLAGGLFAVIAAGSMTVGAAGGALVGGLVAVGVDAKEAKYLEEQLAAGKSLILVDAGERESEVLELLARYGSTNPYAAPPRP